MSRFDTVRRAVMALVVALAAFSHDSAHAQTVQSIRIVVPFAAGGGADILARLLADEFSRTQKVSAVVENRVGGGTVIATEAVARAIPDGSTLLQNANSFVINPSLRKVNYDPFTSFEPVCNLVGTPMFIVVPSNSPYQTLGELLEAARADPGRLSLASLGPATAQHIAFEMLKRRAKVEMTFIPYPGNVPAINAMMGGHVPSAIANYPEIVAHVKTGTLRVLATTTRTRFALLPNVPTVAESGFGDYDAEVWIGLVAPAKTPQQTISQLTLWTKAGLLTPEVSARLTGLGLLVQSSCGADFRAHMRAQFDEYARIIRESNIRSQ
jgi:tripartite-type tricarboxylate transporter receptor subunit TctC